MRIAKSFKPITFWSKVTIGELGECWSWVGAHFDNGYGAFTTGGRHGLSSYAHRTSWMIHFGQIPYKTQVLHRCDQRDCVNPHHLFLGSLRDNMDDMKSKRRQARGETHPGAKLTWEKVREIRNSELSQLELSHLYGVNKMAINNILNQKTWKE